MFTTLITTFPRELDSRLVCGLLEEAGSLVRFHYPHTTPTEEEMISLLQGVHALIAGSEPLTERVLQKASKLAIIARTGVGTDNIDLRAARARGIRVTITPGLTSRAVADLTMGLLLCLARRVCFSDRAVRGGKWERSIGVDLEGRVLGILGLGAIGKLVSRRALAFDMRVVACDPIRDEAFAASHGIQYIDLQDLLTQSDFVSLHLPLTDATVGLLAERELRAMKPTAYLINTARGRLVKESALVRALREQWIAGAALDVFATEPPTGSPLLRMDSVILTPHIGAWTAEAWQAMAEQAAAEVVRALKGEPALHAV